MANFKIVGDTFFVESSETLENITLLTKRNPEVLSLYGGKDGKEEIFRVGVTASEGSIGTFGASFGKTTLTQPSKALISIHIPADVKDVESAKDWVEEKYGKALTYLEKIEERFEEAVSNVNKEKADLKGKIEIA